MIQNGVKNRMILFADEAGFSLHPKLGRMWSKKGKQQPVVYTSSQHRKRLNVIGWVNPISGLHGMMKCDAGNTRSFLAFLKNSTLRFKNKIINLWVEVQDGIKVIRSRFFVKHTDILLSTIYHRIIQN